MWLAGLLEGEASFTWSRSPKVQVEMTDRDVIERVAREMGAKHIARRERRGNQPTYTAAVYGPTAVQVMAKVRPHMGQRRADRIEGIVSRYFGVTPRPVQMELW